MTNILSRILAKTKPNNGCLEYTGALDKDGYGVTSFRIKGRSKRAHRIVYEEINGIITDGRLVLHSCDNPCCCNPGHLFLGTAKDNADDRESKGRGADKSEERNPMVKLSKAQVMEIHQLFKDGETMSSIANRFDVIFQNISLIVKGRNWPSSYQEFHGSTPPTPSPKPRITKEQALDIKRRSLFGESPKTLMLEFGLGRVQIWRIANGKRWS